MQILSTRVSDKEIIVIEAKYKKRFLTSEFGLNANYCILNRMEIVDN